MFDKIERAVSWLFRLNAKSTDRIFAVLVVLFALWQGSVVFYSPLNLSPDEAHYWEWSRRLDYNYYSKGPIIAWLIAASTALFGDTAAAVRLPGLVFSITFSLIWYLVIRRWYGAAVALISWVALRTTLFFATLGLVITTDPPAIFFWLLWIVLARTAITQNGSIYWFGAGIILALAVLSKFTALILFPSIVLFLLITPALRYHLKSPGFALGAVVLILSLIPVALWNRAHGWVTVAHNAAHLGSQTGIKFRPGHVAELVGGQAGLIGPLLLYFCYRALIAGYRRWKEGDGLAGFYLFTGMPLAAVCLAVSFTKTVYVNWPMPVYLSFGFLLCHLVVAGDFQLNEATRALSRSFVINALILVVGIGAILGVSFGLPAQMLPMKKLVGWDELGLRVEQELTKLRARHGDNVFVLTDDYGIASEIAFYTPSHPRVYCADLGNRRMNQYDIWGGLNERKGQRALIVRKYDDTKQQFAKQFSKIKESGEPLPINYKGQELRKFYFLVGKDYNPPAIHVPERF